MRSQAIEARLEPAVMLRLEDALAKLSDSACKEVEDQGVPPEDFHVARRAHLRYEGTDTAVVVDFGTPEQMLKEFEAGYRQQFSFLMPGRHLAVEAVSVEVTGQGGVLEESPPQPVRHAGVRGLLEPSISRGASTTRRYTARSLAPR